MEGKVLTVLMVLSLIGTTMVMRVTSDPDYGDALTKSILFFEGQRSGKLPSNQRMTWRKDSALKDGSDVGMDLVGGYYDAGDNVKFNFPMAFTTTMLAWSVIEFGNVMGSELQNTLQAIRWGTDYLMKATAVPGKIAAQVGDPIADHNCWERPEDMDTLRTSYVVDKNQSASELAGEIAAALAASSIAFKSSDSKYSSVLINRANQVFDYGDKHRGSYNGAVGKGACPFYCGDNVYMDELVWGAAWIYRATKNQYYFNYVQNNSNSAGGPNIYEFGWETKNAGINVLLSQMVMSASNAPFVTNADNFICSLLPQSPQKSVRYSKGGLLFRPGGSNLQHTTSLSFLVLVYARLLESFKRGVSCPGNIVANSTSLVQLAKSQADYILGNNPLGMSYMVGFGSKFPQRIHHRGSSLPSIASHQQKMGCKDGTPYFLSKTPNPNLLVGAIAGGPSSNEDSYADDRGNVVQSEPTTYINAPFIGILAFFNGNHQRFFV